MTDKQAIGGLNDYYLQRVDHPQRKDADPYTAECDDLISALRLNFGEGCIFKALWRIGKTRQGLGKPGVTILYDKEKIEHYGIREAEIARRENAA